MEAIHINILKANIYKSTMYQLCPTDSAIWCAWVWHDTRDHVHGWHHLGDKAFEFEWENLAWHEAASTAFHVDNFLYTNYVIYSIVLDGLMPDSQILLHNLPWTGCNIFTSLSLCHSSSSESYPIICSELLYWTEHDGLCDPSPPCTVPNWAKVSKGSFKEKRQDKLILVSPSFAHALSLCPVATKRFSL